MSLEVESKKKKYLLWFVVCLFQGLPQGIEVADVVEEKAEPFFTGLRSIFSPRRVAIQTSSLLGLWFASSFVYYGIVLFSPGYFGELSSFSPAFFTLLTSLAEIPILVGGGILSLKFGCVEKSIKQ